MRISETELGSALYPARTLIDVGRGKDGGGHGTNVMFVSWNVGGQGDWHPTSHPRACAISI